VEASVETTSQGLTASRTSRVREAGVRVISEAGDMLSFSGRSLLHAAGASRYFAEVLRQCALLALGSTAIIVGLVMVVGAECSLFVTYLLRPIGGSSFLGFNTQICGLREMWPYMFGYIFAAKVGCGLVAEIGSMRISEEIDAMESQGVDPMTYVVATRLLSVLLSVPAIYLIAMVFGTLGSYLVGVVQFGEVSPGQWASLFFGTQTLQDNLFSLVKAMSFATTIALVGLYYGYRARGGPVGVGNATARSMIVNLILIHVIGSVLSALFWGTDARIPYGG
jgi:phospholipid/cholesterol/gamma-HCH transport system permease protein